MQDSLPWLLSVTCAAHRLALACKDASSEVPYMGTFRDHLQSLHLYFHNSANRTAVLRAASQVLGLDNLTVREVKDTRWLSQHLAVSNLQRNLCAVLGALAEEVDSNKCPLAKGLYSYCCTYRFVAAIYLLHLARLSKIFQKENVNFLAIKDQVPVTIACLQDIKDAGNTKAGSFLAQLQTDLDDPTRLGAFGILPEEQRGRRGRGQGEYSQDMLWPRFRSEVMEPYIEDALLDSLDRRFPNIDVMSAFHVLGPQTLTADDAVATANVLTLTRKFLPQQPESTLLQEWPSFKKHMVTGAFKDLDQLGILQKLSARNHEWANLYPIVSKLAAIAMTVPISSVNCERDFSTMNGVKTDSRNRLQGDHLAACLQLSINGQPLGEFPYHRALEMFCKTSRKNKCQIPPAK
ncbi:zinc finger protein 862-like, partial [Nothobranchius furzeri]